MAEKEGKNINTALKGMLGENDTLIGLVGGNVRQIETDVEGGLMTFDKGVSKDDINVEGGVTGFEPIGKVVQGDKRAVSGDEVFDNLPILGYNTNILNPTFINGYIATKGSVQQGRIVISGGDIYTSVINLPIKGLDYIFVKNFQSPRRDGFCHNNILGTGSQVGVPYEYATFENLNNGLLKIKVNKDMEYLSFTVLFNDSDKSKLNNMVISDSEDILNYGVSSINNVPIVLQKNDVKVNKLIYTKSNNNAYIEGETYKQELQVNRALNYPFDIGNVIKDNTRIGTRIDSTAPYRLDGNTIGGNHLVNGVIRNKNHKVRYFCDENEVYFTNDLSIDFNIFKVFDFYKIMKSESDEVIAETNIIYTFNKVNKCIIDVNIIGLVDNIPLQDIMFLMSEKILDSEYVIPNTENMQLPIVITSNTYAREINSIKKNNPQNRVVNISPEYVFKIGFLPLGSNLKREQNTTRKRLEIRGNTGKIYMSTIDSENITTLNKGDIYSAVGYKDYSLNNGKDYSITEVIHNGITYIIIDIYSSEKKQIKYNLPSDLQFKELQNDYDNLYSLTNNIFEIYTDKASIILSSY